MRLRKSGRLLYAFITLTAAYLTVTSFNDGSWLAFVSAALLVAVAGYPAATGRDPLATSAMVPEWMRTMEHRAPPPAMMDGQSEVEPHAAPAEEHTR